MNATTMNPKLEKTLRYLSAYALYIFFILFALTILWCLRSDLLLLFLALSIPKWSLMVNSPWGLFFLILPFVVLVAGLEPYMNNAARKKIVRQRALKVLWIEGGIGLVIFAWMGVLALAGYPPLF
jgi:hypothetical protein